MKTHFILLALCEFCLLTKAAEMMVEGEEDDGAVFHHGFSMADEMDDEESGTMEDEDMESERMADPLRLGIHIRQPPPFGFGFGGYADLGGFAGLGGLGLSGGFGLGFDDNESHDETFEDEDSTMRSASDPAMEDDSTDDEERMADPLRIHVHVHRRHGIPSSDSGVEMNKDMLHEIMADPQLRFRLRARFDRWPFGFGRPFGFPFGFTRFGGGFFGRRSPLFFDNPHSDDDSEAHPTNMDNEEERAADPLIEDINIKERIRIRVPDRYGRYDRIPLPFIRRPRIILDETESITTKPRKLSPVELLARARAKSAQLRQRFGLLTPDSFWCRRSGSVDCRGRRRPFMMPSMIF